MKYRVEFDVDVYPSKLPRPYDVLTWFHRSIIVETGGVGIINNPDTLIGDEWRIVAPMIGRIKVIPLEGDQQPVEIGG